MITADQIRDLRTASSDHAETQRLLSRFESLSRSRRPFYLTGEEADLIFRWKLRSQYGRQKALRDANPEEAYRAVTRAAFESVAEDPDVETEIRLGILTSLRGVGVPVASAILALVEPHKYCVIDFRGWRQVFGEDKRSFSVDDYKRYLAAIRELAAELGWGPMEVDLAVWERDRREGQ